MIWFLFGSWISVVVHVLLIVSLIGTLSGTILGWIPFVRTYGVFIKGISIVLLIASIFFEGYIFSQRSYLEKIKEYEEKVKVAEQKSKDTNRQLSGVIKQKSKDIRNTQVIIQQQIKELGDKIDTQCKVVPEAIEIHNKATRR